MASFTCKNGQVLLVLFCLMHTSIDGAESNANKSETGYLAIVEASHHSTKSGSTNCAGVWTSKDFILTAASCLDQDGKLRLGVNGTVDVFVWQMVSTESGTYYWNREKDGTFKGKAMFHPKYKRVNGTTVYDLAYVKAFGDGKNHKLGKICSGGPHASKLVAIGRTLDNVTEWEVEQITDKNFAIVNNLTDRNGLSNLSIQGREYKIDPSRQFTVHLKISDKRKKEGTVGPFSEKIFGKKGLGGPIVFYNETRRRCVGGIMISKGVKDNEMYITAIKVYPFTQLNKFFRVAKKLLNAAETASK